MRRFKGGMLLTVEWLARDKNIYLSTDDISLASENYNANMELYPQVFLNKFEYTHVRVIGYS
ncbi:hypothetical protein C5167_042327 [Papaver somniferum]|uniref:Uncharacterized protein n=1 Tax=Papaver somniferum TaxID=3469 RepID=A0A4Y7L5U8_PAPSO|nr:hypothetical protein C5167_042327 [Papaver somniferum]